MDAMLIAGTILGVTGLITMCPVLIVSTVLRHKRAVEAMKHRQEGAPGLVQEMAALRREVTALRETTTKFDMAFDAAISRLEDRVDRLEEGRVASQTSSAASASAETVLRRS